MTVVQTRPERFHFNQGYSHLLPTAEWKNHSLICPALAAGKAAVTVVLILLLSTMCKAQGRSLVIQVTDVQHHPIQGVQVGLKETGTPATTNASGKASILLSTAPQPTPWLSVQIVKSPPGKDLVVISPWDRRILVPAFTRDPATPVIIMVADRGDHLLLENGQIIAAITARINQAVTPQQKDENPRKQQESALESVGKDIGFSPSEIDKAIRSWGEKTQDPYEQGLAALYQQNYPDATRALSQSLEIQRKSAARNQERFADAQFFLAHSLFRQGNCGGASTVYKELLKVRPNDSTVLNDLGLCLTDAGDYTAAEPLFRKALAIDERMFGRETRDVAIVVSNLGYLFYSAGDYAEAEKLWRRSLALDEKILGADDALLARDLNNLAQALDKKGDYDSAEPLFRRAVAIAEKKMSPDDPDLATCLNNFGELLKDKGDFAAAEPLERRALAIREKVLGPNNSDVAESLNNVAMVLQRKKDYDGAEPMYRRALAISEKNLGPDHPDLTPAMSNLAMLLQEKGDYAAAEPLYRRALAIKEHALGPDHPETALCMNNLAFLLYDKGDMAEAKPLLQKALTIAEKALGPDHNLTKMIRKNLEILTTAHGTTK